MAIITSAANGNWSATATWTGGVVPGDGDYATVTHQVVIDRDIGTVGGGGIKRITINGVTAQITLNNSAARTIIFGSTGVNAIGSGTSGNPGTDASVDYYGFLVALGTLNLTATAANPCTITTTAAGRYFYLCHRYNDTASNTLNGAILILRYCKLINCGQNVSTFEGLNWGMNRQNASKIQGSLDVQFCEFTDLYQIVVSTINEVDDNRQLFKFASNTITGVRALHTFSITASSQIIGWIIEDNTELAPVYTAGHTGRFFSVSRMPITFTFRRNALLCNTTVQKGLFDCASLDAGTSMLLEGNLLRGQSKPVNNGAPGLKPGHNGVVTMAKNIIEDMYQAVNGPQLTTPGVLNCTENYFTNYKEAQLGQGTILYYGCLGTLTNNVLVYNDTANNACMLAFFIRTQTSVTFDKNTLYGLKGDMTGTNYVIGVEFGETIGDAAHDNKCRSNLIWRCDQGIRCTDDATMAPDVAPQPLAGVHHNDVYDCMRPYRTMTDVTGDVPQTSKPGFTNGTDIHPNQAVYGDLAVDQQFVDPTRRLAGYDAYAGGPGTVAHLFDEVAKRNGLRGAFNPAFVIETIRLWLFAGFRPTNEALRGKAHDGGDIGAVPLAALPPPAASTARRSTTMVGVFVGVG